MNILLTTDFELGHEPAAQQDTHLAIQYKSDSYWWHTIGGDIAALLHEARYSARTQSAFLTFFKYVICPHLGPAPSTTSARSSLTMGGHPFEYCLEFEGGTTRNPIVKVVVDASPLRSTSLHGPLSMATTDAVVATLVPRVPGFDASWYLSFRRFFDLAHLPLAEQRVLIDSAGHQSPVELGFDIQHEHHPSPDSLPVLAKVYFLPCFIAAARGITRWRAAKLAFSSLPGFESGNMPRLQAALALVDVFLTEKGVEWEDEVRCIATDFVKPEKARLKIYFRCPAGASVQEVRDACTLGGRIAGMDGEDRAHLEGLIASIAGKADARDAGEVGMQTPQEAWHAKRTMVYMSLSDEHPVSASKVLVWARGLAPTDGAIARRTDGWLQRNGCNDPQRSRGKSVEEMVQSIL
ncbi:aromatic prenyltransferase [Mycena albidolilacea]|uniref:Aromatic prenyltransferase n=1 Tax=Mycena albidolilacea TaxID=1033008 RepID=A0AAD7A0H2_9AGAR|nr:aromatic prenyltransferase [Mycena albidolilacea]